MIYEEIEINIEGYHLDSPAKLQSYRFEDTNQSDENRVRPAVIICPGGGYGHVSEREAKPIAMRYIAAGFHAFVLQYHVAPARYPVALLELAKSVQFIRDNAKEWNIDESKIIVNGFSAGGHLVGCLSCFWSDGQIAAALNTTIDKIKPNGCILSYPVITSGEYAHRGSFENLLGEKEELLEKVSLEHQVNDKVPPVFIWHTYTDLSVPVENSLLFVSALRKHQISTEFHMFPKGCHGLALANEETKMADGRGVQKECQVWIDMAIRWINDSNGGSYSI